MLVPFSELSETSKVWIYQANRSFSTDELIEITRKLDEFISGWAAHGSNLKAGYDIKYNRFITIAVDNDHHSASGCSIDASVHFIQQLEKDYNVDLLDKMNVSFKNGEFVAYKNLIDFRKMVKNRSVSATTIVFNNLVTTKGEYETDWEVPMTESWHSRFLK
ncbi:hypothetical protein [Aquimarina agarilytica]|uniref:hypothetical protein n=1 Tax=Aquimarina agarilytica TaxID=1087449 RepID=UPI000289C81B|nr:hypothetical protein [Aquimarina agarilytica]